MESVLLSGVFLTSYLPSAVTNTILLKHYGESDFYDTLDEVTSLFVVINVYINPLYYLYKFHNIRQGLIDVLTCKQTESQRASGAFHANRSVQISRQGKIAVIGGSA